jgi:hypothetical protein
LVSALLKGQNLKSSLVENTLAAACLAYKIAQSIGNNSESDSKLKLLEITTNYELQTKLNEFKRNPSEYLTDAEQNGQGSIKTLSPEMQEAAKSLTVDVTRHPLANLEPGYKSSHAEHMARHLVAQLLRHLTPKESVRVLNVLQHNPTVDQTCTASWKDWAANYCPVKTTTAQERECLHLVDGLRGNWCSPALVDEHGRMLTLDIMNAATSWHVREASDTELIFRHVPKDKIQLSLKLPHTFVTLEAESTSNARTFATQVADKIVTESRIPLSFLRKAKDFGWVMMQRGRARLPHRDRHINRADVEVWIMQDLRVSSFRRK